MRYVNRLFYSIVLLFFCSSSVDAQVTYSQLLNAKQLTLTTKKGTVYYYVVSDGPTTMLHLLGDRVALGRDTFAVADVKAMRLSNLDKLLLDEDATVYDKMMAYDFATMVFKRTLRIGQWNSVVLPVALTGRQVRDVFGEEARLAQVRGFREGDNAAFDLETIAFADDETVISPGLHYLLWPTAQPQVDNATAITVNGQRVIGPAYLLPGVSLRANQAARTKTYSTADASVRFSHQGSFVARDGSSKTNRKVAPGSYILDDDGLFSLHNDSTVAKAFSSWFFSLTDQPQQVTFYLDGVSVSTTRIAGLTADQAIGRSDDAVYDLRGRRVAVRAQLGSLPRGIYVMNGRKFVKP